MVRAIAAVIVGYIGMFVIVAGTFTAAYLIMGADRAFKEASYDISTMWIVLWFVVTVVAAVLGGLISASIALPGSKAPMVFAALVLVFGLIMAIPTLLPSDKTEPALVRTGDVSNIEAMKLAEQPMFTVLLEPFMGAIGIVIGVRLRGRRGPSGA